MAKKKDKNSVPLPILIIIYAVLLYASYNSLAALTLGLWGETVLGTVDSYDSILKNSGGEVNRSRTITKGYYFFAEGKKYKGYVIYYSDEAWPRLKDGDTRSERIRYISFFPYINKPSMLIDFDEIGVVGILYRLFLPVGCLFLFLLASGRLSRQKRKKKKRAKIPSQTKKEVDSQEMNV